MTYTGMNRASNDSSMPSWFRRIVQYRYIYLLILPGLLFFIVFKYVPLWGLLLSFMDYNPYQGMWNSEWVGLQHFINLFNNSHFYIMLRNTLLINLFGLVFFFPLPIVLALMLNEVRHELFKRVNQSIVYMPHFLSWVVVASFTYFVLSTDIGIVNKIFYSFGWVADFVLVQPELVLGDAHRTNDLERSRLGYDHFSRRDGRGRSPAVRGRSRGRRQPMAADLARDAACDSTDDRYSARAASR